MIKGRLEELVAEHVEDKLYARFEEMRQIIWAQQKEELDKEKEKYVLKGLSSDQLDLVLKFLESFDHA